MTYPTVTAVTGAAMVSTTHAGLWSLPLNQNGEHQFRVSGIKIDESRFARAARVSGRLWRRQRNQISYTPKARQPNGFFRKQRAHSKTSTRADWSSIWS